MKTSHIELWNEPRGGSPNTATRVVPVTCALASSPDLRALFVHAYPHFAERCRAVDQPGVALIAVDTTGALAGMACMRAGVDRYISAIVGRHSQCDLVLVGDDRLALRQLAVVLAPVRAWQPGRAEISFRILDLRTAEGMLDEQGRPLRGIRAEGPAIMRCAGYSLYALPLGDPTDWPESADDAWAYLPERVYFDELARVPDASIVRPVGSQAHHTTVVTRLRGPLDTAMQLVTDRDLAGRLLVSAPWGQGAIEIGYQALRDGVLLGRYARCDGHGYCIDESMSRVHALLLLVDDRLHVIDIASTNGTREVGRSDARIIELIGNGEIELGSHTRARWCWSS